MGKCCSSNNAWQREIPDYVSVIINLVNSGSSRGRKRTRRMRKGRTQVQLLPFPTEQFQVWYTVFKIFKLSISCIFYIVVLFLEPVFSFCFISGYWLGFQNSQLHGKSTEAVHSHFHPPRACPHWLVNIDLQHMAISIWGKLMAHIAPCLSPNTAGFL